MYAEYAISLYANDLQNDSDHTRYTFAHNEHSMLHNTKLNYHYGSNVYTDIHYYRILTEGYLRTLNN